MACFTRYKERRTFARMKRHNRRHRFDEAYSETYGLPFDSLKNETDLHSVYGYDPNTNAHFIYRRADRGKAPTETWLVFQNPQGRLFRFPLVTVERNICPLYERYDTKEKLWTYRYQGLVQEIISGKSPLNSGNVPISVFLTFVPSSPLIDYASKLNLRQIAHAHGLERWNRRYQKNSEKHQKTQYEQHGHLKGTILLGGVLYTLDMLAVRQHTYGYIDWSYKDRHIRLIALLEDDSRVILDWERYPSLSNLRTGYWQTPQKTLLMKDFVPISEMPYGTNVPENLSCEFKTLDGQKHTLSATKNLEIAFPFENGIYTIYEALGSFMVDGLHGQGIIEFGYHQDAKRHHRKKELRQKKKAEQKNQTPK